MRIVEYIFLVILFITGLTFALLNSQPVTIYYYLGASELPLSMALVGTLIAGCLVGMFSAIVLYLKIKFENKRLRNRVKVIEQEVENLRAIPIRDPH
jgi:putative membrane protein